MGLFSGISKAVKGITGALGGASSAAGLLGAGLGFLGQERANDMNMDIANMNNETMIELANTRYQRQVKDLAAAGLNPMLGYLKLDGGSIPSLQQSKVENSAAAASQAAMTQAQIRAANAQAQQAESQAALNSAQATKVQVDTGISQIQLDSDTASKMARMDADYLAHVARGGKASLERFQQSLDYNTLQELQAMAKHYGYTTIDSAMKANEFRSSVVDLFQKKLKTNELQSYSDMYASDYGKNVAPYLNSARDAGALGVGAAAGALLRKPSVVKEVPRIIRIPK